MKQKTNLPPLEQGLITALKSIDNQIDRQLQRNPAETEKHGVQKWEPMQQRVENITSMLMDQIGDNQVSLEAVLVLAQASTKVLSLTSTDLGSKGLGKVRSGYLENGFETIQRDCREGSSAIAPKIQ